MSDLTHYPPVVVATLQCPLSKNGHIPARTYTVYEEVCCQDYSSRFNTFEDDVLVSTTDDLTHALVTAANLLALHLEGC